MPVKVKILNDTRRSDNHSGCWKVMENLERVLKNHKIVKNIDNCDWVVINGEGTLHHERGVGLLRTAHEQKKKGKKVALINAVWQHMSGKWDGIIKGFDVVIAREVKSFDILYRLNRRALVYPDLSILFPEDLPGDGSLDGVSMARSGLHPDVKHFRTFDNFDVKYYSMRRNVKFLTQAVEIGKLDVYLTAQHHGVYAAVIGKTPFVPGYGNTHKIEGLLRWANIDIPMCMTTRNVRDALKDMDRLEYGMLKLRKFLFDQRDEYLDVLRSSIR